VLKGGDGAIGFAVRQPSGKVVHPYQWKATSEYEESAAEGGYYSVCLDNQFSKFAAKLVNLYLTTFRYDEWERFAQELQDMDVAVQNFTETLSGVDKRIQVMRQFQQLSRGLEARDYNLLEANLSYVNTWSLVQCTVVVISGVLQVKEKYSYSPISYVVYSGLLCAFTLRRQSQRDENGSDSSQSLKRDL